MTRRGWLKRFAAAAVLVAASPAALVAPRTWAKVKDWRNGYLTEEQSRRFIQLLLDESVFVDDIRVTPSDWPRTRM